MENQICAPADPDFRLIETFRWEPGTGVARRAGHLARLDRSAAQLGITPCNIKATLDGITGDGPLRVRLTVDTAGDATVTCVPFTPLCPDVVWKVALTDDALNSGDPWLRVKSTQRAVYDRARASMPAMVDELLFCNERGEVCEGTITNLFALVDGKLLTPALSCGLLPGVLRQELLDSCQAIEATLTPNDLRAAQQLFVGNSLRGLIAARLAD